MSRRSLNKMKDPVKLLISLLAIVAVGLTFAFFLPERTNEVTETPEQRSLSSASEDRENPEMKSPEIEAEEDVESPVSEKETPARAFDVDAIAMPVEGNPIVVTLREYPELGQISIEEWSDEAGEFTGKPVKSGTKLTIMNPLKKGERIRIIAP